MTDLFDYVPPLPSPPANDAFDGITYHFKKDHDRLKGQLERVYRLMLDGKKRTLADIAFVVGGSEASISARLRDLRKEKYGYHEVKRERVSGGLYRYWVVVE